MSKQSDNTRGVCIWVANDEGLYNMAKRARRRGKSNVEGAKLMLEELEAIGLTETPDGDTFTLTALKAAISEL